MTHQELMDRIYRFQRYFYDATRILILPGRDALLKAVRATAGSCILEMGCGTGRNLIKLARLHPEARLFGIDISKEMLGYAARKIRSAGLDHRITIVESPAEAVHYRTTFGLDAPFDAVIFSYALSMMPTHDKAIDAAKESLTPEGDLYAVDFWDAMAWPGPLRALLTEWLALFHVRFETTIHTEISNCFPQTEFRPIKGRYAFIATPKAL